MGRGLGERKHVPLRPELETPEAPESWLCDIAQLQTQCCWGEMGCQDKGLPRNSQGASLVYTVVPPIWWKMRTNPRLSSALHTLSVAHITILTHVNVCTHTHTCTPALSLPFSLSKNKKRNKAIHSPLASVQLMIYGYDEGAHLVPIAVCILPGNSETWLRLFNSIFRYWSAHSLGS